MSRLEQQIAFIVEIDKLKHIYRKTKVIGAEGLGPVRHENSAEHSWHIALMAIVLLEHSNAPVDLLKVIKMLLVHDIVEIDAGDTFAFADQSNKSKDESAAAERIFGLLPEEQGKEFMELWQEFDAQASAEARYANSMDRLMPVLHNMNTQGGSWADHGITRTQVNKRLSPIGDGSDRLWQLVTELLNQAETKGYLQQG
ncbi:MAG: HD domain-containing protein [Caldilineaceae bacterium]